MAGQGERRDQHHVDADVFSSGRKSRLEGIGRSGHAAQAPSVDGSVEIGLFAACFDLNEGDRAATLGNKINLTNAQLHTESKDAPTV
jgi:hypothetical protein